MVQLVTMDSGGLQYTAAPNMDKTMLILVISRPSDFQDPSTRFPVPKPFRSVHFLGWARIKGCPDDSDPLREKAE